MSDGNRDVFLGDVLRRKQNKLGTVSQQSLQLNAHAKEQRTSESGRLRFQDVDINHDGVIDRVEFDDALAKGLLGA